MHVLLVVAPPHGTPIERAQSLLGLVAFIVLAYLIGKLRGAGRFPWRVVIWGVILAFAFGAIARQADGAVLEWRVGASGYFGQRNLPTPFADLDDERNGVALRHVVELQRELTRGVAQGGRDLYISDLSDYEAGKTAPPRVDEDGLEPPIPPSGPACDAEYPKTIRF